MLLDARGGRVRERLDRLAALGEEDQPRAAVARVRAALDVAHALELADRLGHRLLAHAGERREFRDADASGRHEREHVGVRGADVAEARLAVRGVDVLGVVLVDEPEEEADHRPGWEGRFHDIRQVPVYLLYWSGTCRS
jgi:hypothetical protein